MDFLLSMIRPQMMRQFNNTLMKITFFYGKLFRKKKVVIDRYYFNIYTEKTTEYRGELQGKK